jgi:cytochrome oxidase Cu insertion factor (SCO1/SenC/PrrC family)
VNLRILIAALVVPSALAVLFAASRRQHESPGPQAATESCCVLQPVDESPSVATLTPPEQRKHLNLQYTTVRQDGEKFILSDLVGKPAAISFVYTSCANPLKCQRVTSSMADLQKHLRQHELEQKVNLVLITYDPVVDKPAILSAYADRLGFQPGSSAFLLSPSIDPTHALYRDFDVAVSFGNEGVAIHSIQLLLIDKKGRLGRTYSTLIWDNVQVLNDLQTLESE